MLMSVSTNFLSGSLPAKISNKTAMLCSRSQFFGVREMTEEEKDKVKATAAAGVGAGVGTAGGASVGVLELAAQGAVTGLSAGVVIGVGAVAGALLGLAGYSIYRKVRNKRKE